VFVTEPEPSVAGEPFPWPGLTSAETFEFLARLHGGVDVAYRATFVERFQLDPHKKIRALSKGNRQKVRLIAALASRAELLLPTVLPRRRDSARPVRSTRPCCRR
jgi:ABC-type multidrug transport system ATPase subunit